MEYRPIDTPGTKMYHPSNGSPRTANTWGILLSMRSRKQTKRRQLLMESSLAYLRGKEKQKSKAEGGGEVKFERRTETRVPRGREARHI
ncbi:hypothetical protein AVEN_156205-1 [Araneus ventricosus]|uniref:Uncharacterized protein n=1 Tax=Araneus ventricosus TaxID=182803 RepID=A0A4Y2Q3Y0_ARAVE|nr:hypothetical protein AVEN_40071-1 [Araneus ventricosus]GBN58875.1 hypothetical protein AVEN_156205-1 [Araneus ventricosus]